MSDLHQSELAFFGRITAGVTHELKNVLATINESSGLIQDLMSISKETTPYQDKYQRAFASIKNQVRRGEHLITRLNRFAHAPDFAVQTIDPVETAVQLIALSQRLAALKKATLKAVLPNPSQKPLRVTVNSIEFQLALFTAIECWLETAAPGNELEFHFWRKEASCAIRLAFRGNSTAAADVAGGLKDAAKWLFLQEIVRRLGGAAAWDECEPGIVLLLPEAAESGE